MKLLQVITTANGRVAGGDSFLWRCWGDNVRCMEFADVKEQVYAHCYYDCKTYDVYLIHLEIPQTDYCWIWYDPAHRDAYLLECQKRNIDPNLAWDDVSYTEILSEDEILSKLSDIGLEKLTIVVDCA